MENEGTLNYLKQSIRTREKRLEELRMELAIILKAIPSIETSLQKDKEELSELEGK